MKGWATLKRLLLISELGRRRVVIGLDFDGTLSPLASQPSLARLPTRTRRILIAMARSPRVRLAILSGRSLRDVKLRARLPGVYHAGNHGLEIQGPGLSWRHPQAKRFVPVIRELARSLRGRLQAFPGILLEDKKLALSVHYRQADPADLPAARRILKRFMRPHAGRLKLFLAKKTWEIRPIIDWDKGNALKKIAGLPGPKGAILFAGDDKTDEQGFRTLGPGAVTIRVGNARGTGARFRLKDTRQVQSFLELLQRCIRP